MRNKSEIFRLPSGLYVYFSHKKEKRKISHFIIGVVHHESAPSTFVTNYCKEKRFEII